MRLRDHHHELTGVERGMQTANGTRLIRHLKPRWVYAAIAAQLLVGCSMSNPIMSSGPAPRVEDCAMIQQATPTKYVCNGKVYTSIQLADIRRGDPMPPK
jgi:hypothetical protein